MKEKNAHLSSFGYSKVKNKLLSSCFLKIFNRTQAAERKASLLFYSTGIITAGFI